MPRSSLPASSKPTVILVLQGGGALGAYHLGAVEAMEEAGYAPDWVCGISIGAFNAALVAGNAPGERLDRMAAFWEKISWPDPLLPALHDLAPTLAARLSSAEAFAFGQPWFFTPRPVNPWLLPDGFPGATSFYDPAPVLATLRGLVDFGLLNAGGVRISLGATDVQSGDLVFFDSTDSRFGPLGPEHVLASGSLPPAFPPVVIGGRPYWDGGVVANTPLEAVLRDPPAGQSLIFVIDLWDARGPVPTGMDGVLWRAKQIQYASRTEQAIKSAKAKLDLCHVMDRLRAEDPSLAAPPGEVVLQNGARLDLVHVIHHATDQVATSDAEFSRASIAARRRAGLEDLRAALADAPWRAPKPPGVAAVLHRMKRGEGMTTRTDLAAAGITRKQPGQPVVVRADSV